MVSIFLIVVAVWSVWGVGMLVMRGGVTIAEPNYGTKRKRKEFLWFPKKLNGETRWLQSAEWREKYCTTFGWDEVCWEEEGKRRDKNYAENMARERAGRGSIFKKLFGR